MPPLYKIHLWVLYLVYITGNECGLWEQQYSELRKTENLS